MTSSRSPVAPRGWRETIRSWCYGARQPRARSPRGVEGILDLMESDRRRTLYQLAKQVREEARLVDRFNLILPDGASQKPRVRVEERLSGFQDRFPHLVLTLGPEGRRVDERVEPVDSSLLRGPEEERASGRQRSPEQVAALHALRQQRRPPPIG